MEKIGPHVPTLVWSVVIFAAVFVLYHRFIVSK